MSEKEFNEIFSGNLVRYLESRNMSQNELAKYLGVSPTSEQLTNLIHFIHSGRFYSSAPIVN